MALTVDQARDWLTNTAGIDWQTYDPFSGANQWMNTEIIGANQAAGGDNNFLASVFGNRFTGNDVAGFSADPNNAAAIQRQENYWAGQFGGDAAAPAAPAQNAPAPSTYNGNPGSFNGSWQSVSAPNWSNYGQYQANPYLQQQTEALAGQFQNHLQRNILPAIRGGAVANGSVGGSRQGIAEGLATAESNTGLANAVTNMYSQDYGNFMNREMARYQADQGFALGQGAQNLSRYQGDQSSYNTARGLDQSQYGLGLQTAALNNQLEWSPYLNTASILSNFTGFGPQTSSSSQGGGWQGALGGLLGGAQLGQNFGWWGK